MFFYQLSKLLLVIGFINFYPAEAGPTISFISPEQIKDIGESVEFHCTTKDLGANYVTWYKKFRDRPTDFVMIALGDNLVFKDARFKSTFDNTTNTFALKIENITSDDSGIYECQIQIDFHQKLSEPVELLVRVPPVISINETTLNLVTDEGKRVQLVCNANGYPRPTITWSRDNNKLLPGGGRKHIENVLKINNVRKEDRGTYICHAENGVGNPDTKSADLEVEFAPQISVPRPKVGQAKSYDIELQCLVEAYPAPAVVWKRKGNQVVSDGHFRVSHFASDDEITKSTLEIRSLKEKHYGDYYCEASNKLGNAEARINLFESEMPDINFKEIIWSGQKSSRFESYTMLISFFLIVLIRLL